MKDQTVFDVIGPELLKAKIPLVVIGGYAVNYYKASRMTFDLDLLMTDDNFEKVKPLFERVGYELLDRQKLCARFKDPSSKFMDIDIVFVDQNTFDGIWKEAKEGEWERYRFKIPSLKHLIALKLHSIKNNPEMREFPDLVDLINLLRVNEVDIEKIQFRELCLKYGTPELYDRIVEKLAYGKT